MNNILRRIGNMFLRWLLRCAEKTLDSTFDVGISLRIVALHFLIEEADNERRI
jgi:hypothetical protein